MIVSPYIPISGMWKGLSPWNFKGWGMEQDVLADNIIYLGNEDLLLVIMKSLEDLEECIELPGVNSRTTVWNWLTKEAPSALFGKLGISQLSSQSHSLGL